MNQAQFESRFSIIKAKLNDAENDYEFKPGEDIWNNVGINPLDVAFTELSELYLEADKAQKKSIFDYSSTAKLPYNLWYFVRRVGKLIQSKDDDKWLKVGITAALIDGAQGDCRDLIVSLVLLRFVSETHSINTRPFFDTALQNSNDELKSVLQNARDHEESSVHHTVQTFGWPELMEDSKNKFGEHPLLVEQKQRQEENQQARNARQINCSTVIMVTIILILGLVVLYFVLIR